MVFYHGENMKIDEKTVSCIKEFIGKKRREKGIINRIIRDDVFAVLEEECTVLYYSLEDSIEGCHIVKPVNHKMQQFVFINTSKTVQEQVWTAAHELGHVWEVDKYVRKCYPENSDDTETLVGRFAAELLMPDNITREEISSKLDEYHYKGTQMEVSMMMELIAYLMNFFCVPYKAIVYRFIELGYILEKAKDEFFVYETSEELGQAIRENQYTRLNQKAESWSISNIQNEIRLLEEEELMSEKQIEYLRKVFRLNKESVDEKELDFKG